MKVTKGMIEGKERIPEGYELRKVEHKEYSFTNKQGNVVTVKAHTENVLAAKVKPKKAEPKKTESKEE